MMPLRALLLVALCSCASTVEEPVVPAVAAPSPPRPGPLQYVRSAPVLVLEKVEGAEAARARAVFASVPRALLRDCHPGEGGVIRLTLTAEDGRARYRVEPATSLGPEARRCVLETLSTVEIEGISGDASPSARPPGFTAHFRFEW
jgi:hypothetical protein